MTTNNQIDLVAELPADQLSRLLEAALVTASKDPSRPHLHGVEVQTDASSSKVRVQSTDGHRLTRIYAHAEVLRNCTFLIPRDHAVQLIKAIKPRRSSNLVGVRFNDSSLEACIDAPALGFAYNFQATDDNFPPADRVIPEKRELETGTAAKAIGLNPFYLADVGKVVRALGSTTTNYGGIQASIPPSLTDPVRLDYASDGYEATIVIMPFRMA